MPPKVLLVSVCGQSPVAVRALSLECERVVSSFEGVDLLDVGDRPVAPKWRTSIDRKQPTLSGLIPSPPGLDGDERYDLVVIHSMLARDLNRCTPLNRLLDRAERSALWVHELWAKNIHTQHRGELDWFRRFDRMYIGLDGTVGPMHDALGIPVRGLLHGGDILSWLPPTDPEPRRVIDLTWFGARSAETHEALLDLAARKNLLYMYDTMRPNSLYGVDEHRRAFFDRSHRGKLMFVNPAKAIVPEHRGDQMGEIGYRYVEIAAAGGVMIGCEPTSPTWHRLFNWHGACTHVPVGSPDVEGPVMDLLGDPERLESISRRNRAQALRTMDIAHRWRDILEDFGFDLPPALLERTKRMNELADTLAPPLEASPPAHAPQPKQSA